MSRLCNMSRLAVLVLLVPLFMDSTMQGQELSRGHQLLLEKGLQIQAHGPSGAAGFSLSRWAESNLTTVSVATWDPIDLSFLGSAPGIPWSRWTGGGGIGAIELPYVSNMVGFQLSDEQDLTNAANLTNATNWLAGLRANYPTVIGYTNQYGSQHTMTEMRNYMSTALPDMIMFDTYPFNGSVTGGSPTSWYGYMQKYRLLGLEGNDGTGTKPIPYALYLQTNDLTWGGGNHTPSESEMRLNQFAPWAFGYKYVSAFTYTDTGNVISTLFSGAGDSNPTSAFYQIAETNRQSRNLGPTLVRLLSTNIRFIRGQHRWLIWDVDNDVPDGVSTWNSGADPYITSISADNQGSKNNGLDGDVFVGYFKALSEEFDGGGYENEIYFMIVNGLSDGSGSATETRQLIRIDFDFTGSSITDLQRLSRDTGEVEIVSLNHVSGSNYYLDLVLDGGTGDLFKFNTGAPFIVPEPTTLVLLAVGGCLTLRRRRCSP